MAESLFGQSLSLLLVVAGTVLVIAEALAPGAHFIVLGVALLVAGIVGLFLPAGLGILAPLVLAVLVVVVGAVTLYGYRQFDFYGGKAGQTSTSSDLRGKAGHVTERVTRNDGEVKLEGGGFNPYYRARTVGGEIPEGAEIIVVDPGGGNVLTVESIDDVEDEIDRELARGRRDADTDAASEPDPDTA